MEVKLRVVGGKQAGMEIPIRGPVFFIGRGEECHLRPQSTMVSRKHCGIFVEESSASIEDFGSTNGTFVNGEKTQGRHQLKDGDKLKIGALEFDVLLTVSLLAKKKPKVNSIQEAAARTVAGNSGKEDDLDISDWIEKDDADEHITARPPKTPVPHDTTTGKTLIDTATMPAGSHILKKGQPEQPPKTTGKFEIKKKPLADNSQSAATDILRKLFNKPKP